MGITHTIPKKFKHLAVASVTALFATFSAHAVFPERPITLVVPYSPGGTTDIAARTIAQATEPFLKQTINQYLYDDLPFNPEKELSPIALVIATPSVIAVRAESDIKSMTDLIAKAKAHKSEPLTYASPGIGSSVHLTGAYLEQVAGIEMLHVPFKGVSASMPALIGGQVDILMDNLPSTLSQLKDGSRCVPPMALLVKQCLS